MLYDLAELHHVGIVADDVEAAAAALNRLYGLDIRVFGETEFTCRIDGVAQRTVQRMALSAGPPHVELLRTVPDSPIWRPTDTGIHHLGFVADDVAAVSAELTRRGAPLWMAGGDGSTPPGACYHRDPLGQIVEVLSRATAERLAARHAEHCPGGS
ncbi:VOC family protein [Nocardia sp. NPDC050697]|uniref:VOC family protein n=1 Tax=Nocardia sp. NPDC050697 TaxID=3155158 RepID=UPI0033F50311